MPANARSNAVLTTESKVTIRGQTTIPAPVREALKLKPGLDSIHYEILPGGQVFMCRLGDAEVEALKGKDPENYQRKAATKLLAVVHKVIEEHITVNPSSPAFRHGKSLGSGKNKDWSRVKFGAGRYRLFFRYSEKEKVIILGWMNDENTLRTYGKKTDAYTVFSKMLKRGHPPADWESLTQETEENH